MGLSSAFLLRKVTDSACGCRGSGAYPATAPTTRRSLALPPCLLQIQPCGPRGRPSAGPLRASRDDITPFETWLRSNPLPRSRGAPPHGPAELRAYVWNEGPAGETTAEVGQRPLTAGGGGGGGSNRNRTGSKRGDDGVAGTSGRGGESETDHGKQLQQQQQQQQQQRAGRQPAALRLREFAVSELIPVVEALLRYPRVEWDARRLTWMAYNCTASGRGNDGGGGDGGSSSGGGSAAPGLGSAPIVPPGLMVMEWVPAVRVELPRLAPRPPGCGFGSKAACRLEVDSGGKGWEPGLDVWTSSGSGSSGNGGRVDVHGDSKDLLVSYLDELKAGAGRRSNPQRQRHWGEPPFLQQLHGFIAAEATAEAEAKEEAEELLMLMREEEEHRQQQLPQPQRSLPDQDYQNQQQEGENLAVGPVLGARETHTWGPRGLEARPGPGRDGALTVATAAVLPVNAALVLLSADSAALGVWLDGWLVRHKVLTGYTVRHSAGGSQARRDRRRGGGGGGGSVGAALRRAEAARLWQATAARLAEWAADLAACGVLIRSGDTRVFSQLYDARRPPPPVELRDPRWEGAGLSVPRPRLRDLLAVHRRLSTGRIQDLSSDDGVV